jgi:mannose-1-phosphate guanylyltransferase
MRELHERCSAEVTIALNQVEDPSRFGVVVLESSGRILRFVEKPALRVAPSRLVNAGFYLMGRAVLQKIPSGRKVSLETDVFPRLARAKRLYGRQHRGFWFDVGDMKDFIRANFFFLRRFSRRRIFVDSSARVHGNAKLGPDTIVGARTAVQNSTKLRGSIIFHDSSIGARAAISGAVIADHVSIGNNVRISPGCVISSHCTISDGVRLGRRVIIHPYKEIKDSIRKSGHVL